MFLLGAGASVGAGLPLARQITGKALEHLNASSSWGLPGAAQLLNYIVSAMIGHAGRSGQKPDLPDIESVVSAVDLLHERDQLEIVPFIQTWDSAVESIGASDGSTFPRPNGSQWKHLRQALAADSQFGSRAFESYVNLLIDERVRIDNSRTYEVLSRELRRDLLVTLGIDDGTSLSYLRPLVEFAQQSPGFTVATLNYDLTVETAGKEHGVEFDTGVEAWSATGRLSFDPTSPRLLKLHGSLAWTFDDRHGWDVVDGIQHVVTQGSFSAEPPGGGDIPAVIYGRRGKLRADGPFLDLREELLRALWKSTCLVVVGYAFGDEHVNEVIRRWLRCDDDRWMVFVDPVLADLGQDTAAEPPARIPFLAEIFRLNPDARDYGKEDDLPLRVYPLARTAEEALPLLCQPPGVVRKSLMPSAGDWRQRNTQRF